MNQKARALLFHPRCAWRSISAPEAFSPADPLLPFSAPPHAADVSPPPLLCSVSITFSTQVIRALLRNIGCTCEIVADGEQAVQAWFDRYDVIFMDVQMPVMDGLTATKRIRTMEAARPADDQTARVHIIALTVRAGGVRSLRAGCRGESECVLVRARCW